MLVKIDSFLCETTPKLHDIHDAFEHVRSTKCAVELRWFRHDEGYHTRMITLTTINTLTADAYYDEYIPKVRYAEYSED